MERNYATVTLCISWLTPHNPTHYKWKKIGPNPTRPNTTNNGANSLVVTYFYTQNLSSYRFPKPVRSAAESNLTAWCNRILSNRALIDPFKIFRTFAIVDPTKLNPPKTKKIDPTQPMGQPNPWTTLELMVFANLTQEWTVLWNRRFQLQ